MKYFPVFMFTILVLLSCKNDKSPASSFQSEKNLKKTITYQITKGKDGFQGLKASVGDQEYILIKESQQKCISIAKTADFNKNGFVDVVIETNGCGNCCGDQFQIISFDGEKFNYTDEDLGYDWDGIEINEINGVYQFTVDTDKNESKIYEYSGNQLKVVKTIKDLSTPEIINQLIQKLGTDYHTILSKSDDEVYQDSEAYQDYISKYQKEINALDYLDDKFKNFLISKLNSQDIVSEINNLRGFLDPLFETTQETDNIIVLDNIEYTKNSAQANVVLSLGNEESMCCETKLFFEKNNDQWKITNRTILDRTIWSDISVLYDYVGKHEYGDYTFELYKVGSDIRVKKCKTNTTECQEYGKIGKIQKDYEGYTFWIEGLEGETSPMFSFGEGELSVDEYIMED